MRSLRRLFGLLVLLVALATMYLGAGLPSDLLGGVLLGMTTAAAVLVAFGSPAGKPTVDEVRAALADLGYDATAIHPATEKIRLATVMDVELASGEHYRVDVFGRDQRDAQVAARWWHRLMYKEPGLPVFGSRIQQVEHIGYTMFIADRAGVHAPKVVKTGIGGPDAAVLITTPQPGTPLGELATEQITDDVLASLWNQVDHLHQAGISHNELDPVRILVADGQVVFDDFTAADATDQKFWLDCDVAAVLVATAQRVGNDRAIAAAVTALGKERVGEVLPVVQPASLPAATKKGEKKLSKTLKELRDQAATATGADEVKPLEIQRLTWANIGILAGVIVALAIAIPGLAGIDWDTVRGRVRGRHLGLGAPGGGAVPAGPDGVGECAHGLCQQGPSGRAHRPDPARVHLPEPGHSERHRRNRAAARLPPQAGRAPGVRCQRDGVEHRRRQRDPVGSLPRSPRRSPRPRSTPAATTSDNTSLWVIALVAAAIGVVMWVPKIHDKVVPAVKRAVTDIWAVIRNPKKAVLLFGGNIAGNLIYPALLGLCLLAFHQRLDFAELVCVQIGAGMLGSVAPVPGGIGVQEAALTAGLTTFGIPATPALATVLVFRAITFLIPPFFGYFTLRWLKAQGYA